VKFEGVNIDYCDMLFRPINRLQSFKLYGHVVKLPLKCIKGLTYLRKLTLQIDMLAQTDMEVIIGLQTLTVLRLFFNEFLDNELQFGPEPSQLIELEISCKSKLHVMFGIQEAVENLEVVKLHCYSGTPMQISGLSNLERIREVSVKGSRDRTLERNLQCQIDNYQQKSGLCGIVLRVEESSRNVSSSR
jgi:hypothetical protein